VVFVDTPGVHEAGKLIHKRMMESVKQALNDRDLLLWVVDATQPAGAAGQEALQLLEGNTAPRFLLLNKVDAVRNKSSLLPLIEAYQQKTGFAEVLPISAKTGAGLDGLKAAILKVLPEGPQYFPPDFITDQPERHMAAELIREHVLHQTHQEVPHAVAVTVEQWADTRRLLRIAATVYVERDGQKRILVGTGGAQLKSIGTAARQDIEKLTGRKVFLELFVKVRPKWRDSPGFLDELDWRYTAGKEQ
jgi:GTP-binding protein Era